MTGPPSKSSGFSFSICHITYFAKEGDYYLSIFRKTGTINTTDFRAFSGEALIEQLDKKEKATFYSVLDSFIGKKKLKDALSSALQGAE